MVKRSRADVAGAVGPLDDLSGVDADARLYSIEDVARRARLGRRTVERHAADPRCPLEFASPAGGRRRLCSLDTLRAYLTWLTAAAG